MISGFERAVGPLMAGEIRGAEAYRCQTGLAFLNANPAAEPQACVFMLFDGGSGKTYARCIPHNYEFLAIDWTAAQFGGGPSIEELFAGIREWFRMLKEMGIGADTIDETKPSITAARFSDVFLDINRNLASVVEGIRNARV